MRRYSLNNPHPEHMPDVFPIRTGSSWGGGRTYATGLRCSCGQPMVEYHHLKTAHVERFWITETNKVTNESISSGGRSAALSEYRAHLLDHIPVEEMDKGLLEMLPDHEAFKAMVMAGVAAEAAAKEGTN